MEKNIYPAVFMNLIKVHGEGEILKMDTYLRKKFRGKYYLWHFHKDTDISMKPGVRENEILNEIEQFHAEVYKAIICGIVNTKLVIPGHWDPPKPMFELDPDQTPEEKRLRPEDS